MVAPPSKCSRELSNAVYDDFKRKAVDAAKKRAVAQNVDYDTFKNMVSVAHLRPLQAPNKQPHGIFAAPSWSFAPDGSRLQISEQQSLAASQVLMSSDLPTEPPSTSGEFARDWRRSCPSPDHKYRYLQLCGPDRLRTLFKVEIATDVLKDILSVLCTCWLGHAGVAEEAGQVQGGALHSAVWVAQVLEALSCAGRFSLTVKLIGEAGKQVIITLIHQIQEAADAGSSVATDTHASASSEQQQEQQQQQSVEGSSKVEVQGADAVHGVSGAGSDSVDATGSDSVEHVARELSALLIRVKAAYGIKV